MSENSPKTSAEMEAIARWRIRRRGSPNRVEINQGIRELMIYYIIGGCYYAGAFYGVL
jgi:hypothetical protein